MRFLVVFQWSWLCCASQVFWPPFGGICYVWSGFGTRVIAVRLCSACAILVGGAQVGSLCGMPAGLCLAKSTLCRLGCRCSVSGLRSGVLGVGGMGWCYVFSFAHWGWFVLGHGCLWPTIGWHVHMEFKSCVPVAIRDWCVLPGLCPECTCPWSEEQHPLRAAHSLLRKDSSILGHWHTCRHHLNAPFPSPLVVAEPGCC